jgi:hypothetical protein
MLESEVLAAGEIQALGPFSEEPIEREHAINNYYLRQFACIRNWCQRMRHILSTASWQSRKVQKELRESSRGPSATLVQRLLRIERPRRISMFLKRAFIYLLFHCRDIFVDDVDEEEVESDEVVDGQF